MANYCENTIIISDFKDKKRINTLSKKIERAMKNKKNLLTLITTPKELDKLWEKGLLNVADKLGTKWLFANDICEDENTIELYADSAWSPPTGWAVKLSKRYNCYIRIKFDEPGMCFMGIFIAQNGKIIKDQVITY